MKYNLFFLLCIVLTFSCSQANKSVPEMATEQAAGSASSMRENADATAAIAEEPPAPAQAEDVLRKSTPASDSPMSVLLPGPRKLIKTAEMRSKVDNVHEVTVRLEKVTRQLNGFVAGSNLQSNVQSTRTMPLSRDSVLEITEYVVSNELTLRIPEQSLDSLLNEVSQMSRFVELRAIHTEDVTLKIFGDALKERNKMLTARRIAKASDEKGKKLGEIVQAEESRDRLEEAAIDKKVSNLDLDDRIAFSEVTVHFFQPPSLMKQTRANTDPALFEPSFWTKLANACSFGWQILLEFILALVSIWPFMLLLAGLYLAYRKFKK